MKLLLRLILFLIVLVVVAGVVAYLWIDSIAKTGIEKGGTYAMGVETRVQSVDLSPLAGTMVVNELNVANPAGFSSPHAMHTGKLDVELVPGSLLDNTIVIRKFELDGLSVHVEPKMPKSNISVILDNLKRLGGEGQKADEPAGEGKKVSVDRITVRNVSATFHLPAVKALEVKVPEIELTNVTSDNAAGVAVPELIARIVPAVLTAVLKKAEGVVPPDVLNALNGDVTALTKALGGQTEKLVQQVQGEMQKLLGGKLGTMLPADANGVGGEVTKTVGGVLEGVLGGKKDANAPKDDKKKPGGLLDGILGGKK